MRTGVRGVALLIVAGCIVVVCGFQTLAAGQKIEGGSTDISSLHCKPLTERARFIPQLDLPEGEKKLTIPRVWLVPPDRYVDDDYVSSVLYSTQVTSFPIGNGKIGLHLSSFDWQKDGSAHAAAGRDVFLIYDAKSSTLAIGNLHLGITKQRLRDSGCFIAGMTYFLLADRTANGRESTDKRCKQTSPRERRGLGSKCLYSSDQ